MNDGLIRPGPKSIEPGRCRGGVVIQVYAVPSCVLLMEQRVQDDLAEWAAADAAKFVDRIGVDAVCLVAFDGDTGVRYTVEDWQP